MLKALLARVRQGRRTIAFPDAAPSLPDRFRGRPELDPAKCPPDVPSRWQSDTLPMRHTRRRKPSQQRLGFSAMYREEAVNANASHWPAF